MRKVLKKFLKNNNYAINIITVLLYCYLKFVYFTSKQKFIFPPGSDKKKFLAQQGVVFASWHNMLALNLSVFKGHKDIYALISPHLDGNFLNNIVDKFGYGVIVGSTNKNPVGALRIIIQKLSRGSNIVITPDGPKGPVYKINSSITEIARKYNKKLIPVVSHTSKYFLLKSWDKLTIPLPFGNITVIVGSPLNLTNDKEQNDINLERQLISLMHDLPK